MPSFSVHFWKIKKSLITLCFYKLSKNLHLERQNTIGRLNQAPQHDKTEWYILKCPLRCPNLDTVIVVFP